MKTTKMKEWARREVDLAKSCLNVEDQIVKEMVSEEYEAAYRSYCNFLDEYEKLENTEIIKTVFTQLFHEENLSPIVDSEDDWTLVEGFDPAVGEPIIFEPGYCEGKTFQNHDYNVYEEFTDAINTTLDQVDFNYNPGWSIYQCKRRNSLFKKVSYDRKTGEVDEITFRDIDRSVCIDINKPDSMYIGGMGPLLLDEMMPITLPYSPCGKIRIFTEDFKYHEECEGDLDTLGVLYFRMPDGSMKEVKRYFKEDHESKQMVEINQSEYLSRRIRVEERMKKAQKKTSPEVK